MVEMDRAILSCIYPAENGDMYDRGEVYAALKILYKKMKADHANNQAEDENSGD